MYGFTKSLYYAHQNVIEDNAESAPNILIHKRTTYATNTFSFHWARFPILEIQNI